MNCQKTECDECPERVRLIEAKYPDKHGRRYLEVKYAMADDDDVDAMLRQRGGGE